MPVLRVLAVLLLAAPFGLPAEHQLRVLTGNEPIKGELISIDAKSVVFKSEKGTETKPLAEVLQIDLQAAPATVAGSYIQVELTDGSVLHCKPDSLVFKGKQLEVTVLPDLKVEIPLTALSFILKGAQDAKVRENADWKAILKVRRNHDMVARWFQGRINGITGTFTDGKGGSINFIPEGRDAPLPIDLANENVQGCVFVNKPDPSAPVTVCKLHDAHLSLLMVAKVEGKEGGDFTVTTVSGAQLHYRRDMVVKLDFSRGKLTFLSDIDATVVQEPPENIFFPPQYRRDKNCEGGPLQVGGQRYPKGLFLPVLTKISYKLNGEYNELSAQVGVDDTVRGQSHVRLIIEGDGKELYSAEFKRADKRREVKLNIKDIQELRIAVEPVNPLNLSGNHLNLADIKVNK